MIIEYHLTCERCGSAYTTNRPDARFCSTICRSLIGPERTNKGISQALDNPCTLKVSLLAEVNTLLNGNRKAKA